MLKSIDQFNHEFKFVAISLVFTITSDATLSNCIFNILIGHSTLFHLHFALSRARSDSRHSLSESFICVMVAEADGIGLEAQ
jgi:hypothetical protein